MTPITWGKVEIVEIPPYTDQEAEAVWYNDDELNTISSRVWDIVKTISTGKVPPDKCHLQDEDELCTRGLEEFTVRGSLERLCAKFKMDVAVFEEQKAQRQKGVRDDEALARVSRAESQRHVATAVEYGKKDQESADKYLNRARQPSTKTSRTSTRFLEKNVGFPHGSRNGQECRKWHRFRLGDSLRNILGMKR